MVLKRHLLRHYFVNEKLQSYFYSLFTGEHLIDVRLYDQSVYESPFICNVGDPELVSVKRIPQYIDTRNLNKDHTFESKRLKSYNQI